MRVPFEDDGGTVTVLLLGILMLVLSLGGLSIELWRAFDAWRAVSAAADAAAVAGASGVDREHLRATDQVRLDPDAARRRAAANLARHEQSVDDATITVARDGSAITVTTTRRLTPHLLGLLGGDLDGRTVAAEATVAPQEGAVR